MYCERCDETFKWYEDVCPRCQRPLVSPPAGVAPEPEAPVVSVFRIADEAVLPLATLALEDAGIEYAVRTFGLSSVFGVSHPAPAFDSTGMAVEIQVLAADADAARDLLADLEQAAGSAVPAPATPLPRRSPPAAERTSTGVDLSDAENGRALGTITKAHLDWLAARLELESPDDDDYYVDAATIELLEGDGADPELIATLRGALGAEEGVTIRWTR